MSGRKSRDRSGIGLPFVDYRRGDGPSVGPGTERPWTAIVIDDETPWVRNYRGLWGYDTRDPFGGERAPAGPRYERNGSIRRSWDRPVAWAGLDRCHRPQRMRLPRCGVVPTTLPSSWTLLRYGWLMRSTDCDRCMKDGGRWPRRGSPARAADGAAQAAVDAARDEIAELPNTSGVERSGHALPPNLRMPICGTRTT